MRRSYQIAERLQLSFRDDSMSNILAAVHSFARDNQVAIKSRIFSGLGGIRHSVVGIVRGLRLAAEVLQSRMGRLLVADSEAPTARLIPAWGIAPGQRRYISS